MGIALLGTFFLKEWGLVLFLWKLYQLALLAAALFAAAVSAAAAAPPVVTDALAIPCICLAVA